MASAIVRLATRAAVQIGTLTALVVIGSATASASPINEMALASGTTHAAANTSESALRDTAASCDMWPFN